MPPKNPWPASAATDARAVPPRFAVRPLSLRAANAFVQEHHRHHRPVQGGKFSLAVTLGDSFWRVGPVNDPGRFSKTDATPDFSAGWPYLLWIDGAATVDGLSGGLGGPADRVVFVGQQEPET